MIKKTITYEDYNGNERTETHWFHLSKAELAKMETSVNGGFIEMINKVIEAQDLPILMEVFDDLLLKSYGEKSIDGKYFNKIDENGRPLSNKFKQTEAYSIIFTELLNDGKKAAEFFNAVIPSNLEKNTQSPAQA